VTTVIELLGPSTGGIRVHVAELTRRLRAAGVDARVAAPAGAMGESGRIDDVVPVPARLSPMGWSAARRSLGAVPGDLIHAHGLKAGWVAIAARPRRPVVLTMHNVVLGPEAGGSRLLRTLERFLIRRVDRVIAPSPPIAAMCDGLIDDSSVSVIIPVSPPPQPRHPRDEVRASLGVVEDERLVVVVARLHPQKDLPTFLDAFAKVASERADVRAAIVGEGPLEAELATRIDALGLRRRVRLAGPSDYAVDELDAADVVALTSLWEAIPLVVTEAMQLGRPVVATDVGIVSTVIEDGVDGRVVPIGDADAVAEALSDLLSRDDLEELGQRAKAAVTALVDPDRLTDEVRAVYDELLPR
jgi:glycosyltransferase involved in cell wall biosynthesis